MAMAALLKRTATGWRYRCFFLLLGAGIMFTAASATAAEIYEVDPDHSAITFRVKHLGITFVYGRFNHPIGSYALDDNTPENCFIDIRVRVENIDTGNPERDAHLRSEDFFDAAQFPNIVFKSILVEKLAPSGFQIIGHLSLHGITQFITVQAEKTGAVQIPGGEKRTGFETTFTIQRSHYGMKTMLGGVADTVELTVSIEGILRKSLP
jgi:polyisoprenoid-binding protein YceI